MKGKVSKKAAVDNSDIFDDNFIQDGSKVRAKEY